MGHTSRCRAFLGTTVMSQDDQTNSARQYRCLVLCPVVITVVFALAMDGVADEPVPRHFPTAPTAYRRPAISPPQVRPEPPWNNAEADIPQSHLLYSLRTPREDSVIQQAGGQIEQPVFVSPRLPAPASNRGVIQAGGFFERGTTGGIRRCDCGPACRHDGPFTRDYLSNSPLEHVGASPRWATELSLSSDLAATWARLRDDTFGVLHPNNVLLLAMAGGGAIALRSNADQRVRSYTAEHPERWGTATDILGELGYINVQIPVLLGTYFWSIHTQDEELHDFSATMISAVTINGVSTLIIKSAANTDRPDGDFNGGKFGFPSYHASSSFAMAGVLDEYYGHRVGVPAYALAGLISWSRIDERDHDLSDVVFGAAMGFVIGKSVARHHLVGDSRVQILPWFEPIGGTSGLQLSAVW